MRIRKNREGLLRAHSRARSSKWLVVAAELLLRCDGEIRSTVKEGSEEEHKSHTPYGSF